MSASDRGFAYEVEILTAPIVTDPYTEEEVADWDGEVAVSDPVPADVQPISSSEAVLTAGTVISRWRLFLRPYAALVTTQRVRWQGDDYAIDGKVEDRSPGLVRCYLKLVSG